MSTLPEKPAPKYSTPPELIVGVILMLIFNLWWIGLGLKSLAFLSSFDPACDGSINPFAPNRSGLCPVLDPPSANLSMIDCLPIYVLPILLIMLFWRITRLPMLPGKKEILSAQVAWFWRSIISFVIALLIMLTTTDVRYWTTWTTPGYTTIDYLWGSQATQILVLWLGLACCLLSIGFLPLALTQSHITDWWRLPKSLEIGLYRIIGRFTTTSGQAQSAPDGKKLIENFQTWQARLGWRGFALLIFLYIIIIIPATMSPGYCTHDSSNLTRQWSTPEVWFSWGMELFFQILRRFIRHGTISILFLVVLSIFIPKLLNKMSSLPPTIWRPGEKILFFAYTHPVASLLSNSLILVFILAILPVFPYESRDMGPDWVCIKWNFAPFVFIIGERFLSVGMIFWFISDLVLLYAMLLSISPMLTKFSVTNQRILAKIGLMRGQKIEILLPTVKNVAVEQNILGMLLDFGTLTITNMDGTKKSFKSILQPMDVKGKMEQVIEDNRIDMNP